MWNCEIKKCLQTCSGSILNKHLLFLTLVFGAYVTVAVRVSDPDPLESGSKVCQTDWMWGREGKSDF